MKVLVNSQDWVQKLWGCQRISEGKTYRLMDYVLREESAGDVLLLNLVTGELVLLDGNEAELIQQLPTKYNPTCSHLIKHHFLVPKDYDEFNDVVAMRKVLWQLFENHASNDITYFTILPTTACNARCFYCFQQGVKRVSMDERTANDLVAFIHDHCGKQKIRIRWFGGEPTFAHNRITQVCEGLTRKGVQFSSLLSTNGYLLDKEMIRLAKEVWNLLQVTITVDGTEKHYNSIKAFVNQTDNPYLRVMDNISELLSNGVRVGLRMNYDQENYEDFEQLLIEAYARWGHSPLLRVYAHPINKGYYSSDLDKDDSEERWFNTKALEFYTMSTLHGYYNKKIDSCTGLVYHMCEAALDSAITVTPEGNLVSCGEQIGDDQIVGNVRDGITNFSLRKEWKNFGDRERCSRCTLFPICPSMRLCAAGDRCFSKELKLSLCRQDMVLRYNSISSE